jgi:hypothetical protein
MDGWMNVQVNGWTGKWMGGRVNGLGWMDRRWDGFSHWFDEICHQKDKQITATSTRAGNIDTNRQRIKYIDARSTYKHASQYTIKSTHTTTQHNTTQHNTTTQHNNTTQHNTYVYNTPLTHTPHTHTAQHHAMHIRYAQTYRHTGTILTSGLQHTFLLPLYYSSTTTTSNATRRSFWELLRRQMAENCVCQNTGVIRPVVFGVNCRELSIVQCVAHLKQMLDQGSPLDMQRFFGHYVNNLKRKMLQSISMVVVQTVDVVYV